MSSTEANQPLAIVGLACRLPGGSDTPSLLWEALLCGRSGRGSVPKSRFHIDAFYHPDPQHPASINSQEGYFLDNDIRAFDHEFFNINSLEARYMDPQQRQLLEVAFECIESAGITLDDISAKEVGCYIANFTNDFTVLQAKDPELYHRYSGTGMGIAILANRISHCFNLKGPSVTIDTACSSSFFALHQACAALRAGECDAAFVGGANLIQSPELYMGAVKAGMISGTAACHTFDISADGYARAEGVGVLYVKRLKDAVLAGDPIRSIIRGTAVNCNGRTNGISLPSPSGQEAVIRKAYANARLSPNYTDYIEAHGTGTEVGDGIEIDAFSRVLKHKSGEPILIGSIKTSLGHSEAVSGISSLIKMTLALEHGIIPQTIGVETVHPKLLLEERNVSIVTTNTPWPDGGVRRASLNSFGYGGSNGHVILEDAYTHVPPKRPLHTGRKLSYRAIPLSCRSEQGLDARRAALANIADAIDLDDIAYSLSCRRSHFENRGFLIATEQHWRSDIKHAPMKMAMKSKNKTPILFAFTGQGAQWAAMGAALIDTCQVFADTIDSLDKYLSTIEKAPNWRLRGFKSFVYDLQERCAGSYVHCLTKPDILAQPDVDTINQPVIAQPACTALQIGLVSILKDLAVLPTHVIGHSSGEIAAAYATGCITAQEAIAISYYRGLAVSKKIPPGAMGVLGCDEQTALCIIDELGYSDRVEIACFNSPVNLTISGDPAPIETVICHAQAKQIFARSFNTGNKAYHSKHMTLIGERYEELITPVLQRLNSACNDSVSMTSTLFGRTVKRSDVRDPKYWRQNLEKPVLFSRAMSSALAEQEYHVVEIGPHSTFKIAMTDISTNLSRTVQYSPTVVRDVEPAKTIMQLTGNLFLDGFDAPIKTINSVSSPFTSVNAPVVVTNLPSYPWKRGPVLWSEGRASSEYRHRAYPRHDLIGSSIVGGSRNIFSWRNVLKLQNVPWINDHRLGDTIVFPAAGYIAMIIEAFQQVMGSRQIIFKTVVLRDIKFLAMLTLDTEDVARELFTELCVMQSSLVHPSENKFCFTVSSFASNISTIHCRGIVEIAVDALSSFTLRSQPNVMTALSKGTWYRTMRKEGLNFGTAFQRLDGIKHAQDYSVMEVLATCDSALFQPSASSYPLHPTAIDSLFQASIISTTSGRCNALKGKIPVSIDKLMVSLDIISRTSTVRASSMFGSQHSAICNAEMFDGDSPLAIVNGLKIVPWRKHDFNHEVAPRQPFLEKVWIPEPELELEKSQFDMTGMNNANGVHVQQPGLIILPNKDETLTTSFRESLMDKTGIKFKVAYLEDLGNQDIISQAVIIACLEINQPLLSRMNADDLQRVQSIFRNSSQVVWVHSADSMGHGKPEFGLVSGLSRALTFEQPGLTLCTFDIGHTGLTQETCANLSHIVTQVRAGHREREYSQKQGVRHVPRYLPALDMNSQFHSGDHSSIQISLEDAQKCHLTIKTPGVFQTLAFCASTDVPTLDPNFVEVQVKAASINAKDYYALRGLADTHNATCSLDFSGIVTGVGAAVRGFAPGDRVVGMAPNHLGSYVQIPEWTCCKLERDESFVAMAAVPIVFATALYALQYRAQLRAGETILIHSAAGGAGIAAIQVAKIAGAHIFATVGTDAKKEFLIQEFGLVRENIFSSRNAGFAQGILEATQGAGVDVVFNSLIGELLHASWTACADFGRFVDVSKRDCLDGGRLDMRPFSRSVAYHAFDLSELYYSRNSKQNAVWQELLCQSMAMLRTGAFVPVRPLEIFDVSQIADAFTYFGSATRMGKIVISFEDPTSSIPYRPPRYGTSFDNTRAYLLVGCLGGLGRTLSSWMVDLGARHLVFMGRKGATSPAAAEHIRQLKARGAHVMAVKGDVSVLEDVERTVQAIKVPVAGVIHAAMNLEESLFDDMTATQWHSALGPKVRGAWNLHRAFAATPLDFFLMTSSVAGTVGLATESNYCAANAYLDALARHRRQVGLPAISIALGCISEVGYLHERPDVEKMLRRKGIQAYNEDEVVKIVDAALCFADNRSGHVVTGLEVEGIDRLSRSGSLHGTIFDDVRLAALIDKAKANFDRAGEQSTARSSLEQDLDAAISGAARGSIGALKVLHECVCAALRKILAAMLLVEPDRVAQDAQLANFGMDSMLGAEFRTTLFKNLGCDVPLAVLLQERMDMSALSTFITAQMLGKSGNLSNPCREKGTRASIS